MGTPSHLPIIETRKVELPTWLPAALKAQAAMVRLGKGQWLFRAGDTVEHLFFIHTGELAALRFLPDGAESIMLTARAGDFFGEAGLFISEYTCDARARSPCLLVAFTTASFRQVLGTDAEFSLAFTRTLLMSLRRQCSRVERLRLKKATDRVMHFLLCEAGPSGWVELGGTVQGWAAELGLEPETLYRTLSQLERDGTVTRELNRLRLSHGAGTCQSALVPG